MLEVQTQSTLLTPLLNRYAGVLKRREKVQGVNINNSKVSGRNDSGLNTKILSDVVFLGIFLGLLQTVDRQTSFKIRF